MKLSPSIQTKQTIRLFNGKYKYKIVLLSKAASFFRGGDLANVKRNINTIGTSSIAGWAKKLSKDDIDFVLKIVNVMTPMRDYSIRVETPYINFYTNNSDDVEKLSKIDKYFVKYICLPAPGSEELLDNKKVIVKNLDYSYKITMGRTRTNHSNFVNWCVGKEDRIRLTKSASKHLSKNNSWGGYYFYVKDDKTLTMVKMFLGEGINSVENVVKT